MSSAAAGSTSTSTSAPATAGAPAANVLAYGSVNGHLDKLLKTVAKALTQRSFAAVFIAGDLFGSGPDSESHVAVAQSVLDGTLAFPIPTFFIAGKHPLPQPIMDRIKAVRRSPIEVVEIAPNLFFCSGSGIHIEPNSGLRFAYLSGIFDPTRFSVPADPNVPHRYTHQLIDHLLATPDEHIPLDLLLTYESPVNMSTPQAAATHGPVLVACQSPALTSAVNTLMPRYHFCGGPGTFIERAPFAHVADLAQVTDRGAHFTRFLSIGRVPGLGEKQTGGKWAYAFAVVPFMLKFGQEKLDALPEGCTASPLAALLAPPHRAPSHSNKREHPDHDDRAAGEHVHGKRPRYGDRPPFDPQHECWFCLACPKADRNLVFTVGRNMYGAVAKGQLLPGHVLFVPRAHVQNWYRIQAADPDAQEERDPPKHEALDAMQELCSMQRAVSEMHAREGKVTVTWQIADIKPNGSMHAHCQVLPVDVPEGEEAAAVEWMLKRLLADAAEETPGEEGEAADVSPFVAGDEQSHHDDQPYTGPVSPTLEPTAAAAVPTTTVVDRIAAAFTTKLAPLNLHPITYRIPATSPTSAAHLGSLTATLYHLRAHQLAQLHDPHRPRDAPRIPIVNPTSRHLAMLVGDRLLFVPVQDPRLRFPFSLPREAVATALGMGDESAQWRTRAEEDGEREKEYAVARALARRWARVAGPSARTGVSEVDDRLAQVGSEGNGQEEHEERRQWKQYGLGQVQLDRTYFQRHGGWTWEHFEQATHQEKVAAGGADGE